MCMWSPYEHSLLAFAELVIAWLGLALAWMVQHRQDNRSIKAVQTAIAHGAADAPPPRRLTAVAFWSTVLPCVLCPLLSIAFAYAHFDVLSQCVRSGAYPRIPSRVIIVFLANPAFAGLSLYGFVTVSLPVLRQMRRGEY